MVLVKRGHFFKRIGGATISLKESVFITVVTEFFAGHLKSEVFPTVSCRPYTFGIWLATLATVQQNNRTLCMVLISAQQQGPGREWVIPILSDLDGHYPIFPRAITQIEGIRTLNITDLIYCIRNLCKPVLQASDAHTQHRVTDGDHNYAVRLSDHPQYGAHPARLGRIP